MSEHDTETRHKISQYESFIPTAVVDVVQNFQPKDRVENSVLWQNNAVLPLMRLPASWLQQQLDIIYWFQLSLLLIKHKVVFDPWHIILH